MLYDRTPPHVPVPDAFTATELVEWTWDNVIWHHDTANACRNVILGIFSPRISARFSRLAVVAEGMGRAHYLWTTPVVGAVVLFCVLLPCFSWVSDAQKCHLCTTTTQYFKNVVSFVKKTQPRK
ncbi:hypothetical protein AVEN_144512-1 [Araneus ventricosus]|uniref:Uncharacterized protein n=1 Tax=Araneus ventricosus TaxID=182803 RepID=A0A4Y2LBK3_ARAVE|nr:hypothetical protein AVEN_144512-1 [Araneus ventricosus]